MVGDHPSKVSTFTRADQLDDNASRMSGHSRQSGSSRSSKPRSKLLKKARKGVHEADAALAAQQKRAMSHTYNVSVAIDLAPGRFHRTTVSPCH